MKKIMILFMGLLMLFGASPASASTDGSRNGSDAVIPAQLISKQPAPTPHGMLAVYTADVATGKMEFKGFEADWG